MSEIASENPKLAEPKFNVYSLLFGAIGRQDNLFNLLDLIMSLNALKHQIGVSVSIGVIATMR